MIDYIHPLDLHRHSMEGPALICSRCGAVVASGDGVRRHTAWHEGVAPLHDPQDGPVTPPTREDLFTTG